MAGDAISVKPPSVRDVFRNWINRNQRLVYTMFALLFGFLLCAPAAFAFFAADFADVYSKFPDAKVPWLYTIRFPTWLSLASIFLLFLVIWPSIGFCNALISKPKTSAAALYSGLGLAAVLSLIFYCMLGWLVFLQGARMQSSSRFGVLANAVWPAEGSNKEQAVNAADELYDGLEQIPLRERAAIVKERMVADHFSTALGSFGVCVLAAVIFAVPIFLGTFVAFVLQNRGLPVWLTMLRYLIAWWALAACSVGLTLSVTSLVSDEFTMTSDWTSLPIAFAVFLAVEWLALRRWKKTPESGPSDIAPA